MWNQTVMKVGGRRVSVPESGSQKSEVCLWGKVVLPLSDKGKGNVVR